jgi:hypothetical protein
MLGSAVPPATSARPAAAADADVAGAEQALDRATAARQAADVRLARVRAEAAALGDRVAALDRLDAGLTSELAEARRAIREYAVAAYIDGGQGDLLRAALSSEQVAALAWRTAVLSDQAGRAAEAADRFDRLRADNDPERAEVAARLDRLSATEAEAASDALQAAALERDAELALAGVRERVRAQRQAAAEAARAAATTAPPASPPPSPTAARPAAVTASRPPASVPPASAATAAPQGSVPAPAPPQQPPSGGPAGASAAEAALLAKIRQCESGGNYAALSPSGTYRGAYQFSVATWRAVGGTGDPAQASPAEQDLRALLLLRSQGPRAWPHCSR